MLLILKEQRGSVIWQSQEQTHYSEPSWARWEPKTFSGRSEDGGRSASAGEGS
jgi:hypothetical protein